jgi:hypothetical protein
MNLSSKDYYCLTPAETYFKLKGFETSKWIKWQHTRLISYNVYASVPRKKNASIMSIEKFFPLPTDKKVKFQTSSKKMDEVFAQLKANINGN